MTTRDSKLGGRIPVEPLDDIRLTNIERRVVLGASEAAAARPVRAAGKLGLGFGLAMAATAAMAAGVVGWKLHGPRGGGSARGTELATSTKPVGVHTDVVGSTLDIGDAVIASDPDTQFAITRPDGKVVVTMTRGRVELEVAKRKERPPLIVHAGDTDVIVVGTHFSVDYGDGTGAVDVHVTEGVVRVERQAHEVRVAAGQAWSSRGGSVVASAALPERAGGVHLTAAGTLSMAEPTIGDGGDGDVALGGTVGSGGYEIDTSTTPDVLRDRVAAVPDPHVPTPHRPHHVEDGSTDADGSSSTTTDTVVTPPADPHADLKALIRKQTLLPALDVGAVTGERAMAIYRDTATREKGTAAAFALYSMAVTQHLKLGRNADALGTIETFLRRFNGGDYYDAVLWLRVRVTCLRSIDDKCRAAATQYMSHAPQGPASSVAELITMAGEP